MVREVVPRNRYTAIKKKGRPSFFMLIIPGFSTEHLRIPPQFRKHIVKELSERETLKLEQSLECSWTVAVKKVGRDVYFKDGWQEFLRDNSICSKDLLVFIYKRRMRFSVRIFDKNGCERMDFPDTNTHQNSTISKTARRTCGRPESSTNGISGEADILREDKQEEDDCNNDTGTSTHVTHVSTKTRRGRPKKSASESSKRTRDSENLWSLKSRNQNSAPGEQIPISEFDLLKEFKEEGQDYEESAQLLKSKSPHFNSLTHVIARRTCGRPENYTKGISGEADILREVNQEEDDYNHGTRTSTLSSTKTCRGRPKKSTSESSKRTTGTSRKSSFTCSERFRSLNSRNQNSAPGEQIPISEFDVLKEVKEEQDYEESAQLLKSKSVHYTTKINRLTQVYVSTPFYKKSLSPRRYEVVFVRNSVGTVWYQVKLSSYRDTVFMTKGWHDFAVANHVKLGTICKFEHLKENKIIVHIVNR